MKSITIQCTNCNHDLDSTDATMLDDAPYCEDCVVVCEDCSVNVVWDDAIWTTEEETVCTDCNMDHFFECDGCNGRARNDEAIVATDLSRPWRDRYVNICQRCAENDWWACDSCGEVFHHEDMRSTDYGDAYCEPCYDENEGGEEVHDYSYRPAPLFTKLNDEDTLLYLGIELEVEGGRGAPVVLAGDTGLLYCKHDGSLDDGFEVVSHPLSYGYWKTSGLIEETTATLREYGATSFNTSTCGMHIHMSRAAFTSAHMWKFIQFMYRNASPVQVVAQRKDSSWAEFIGTHRADYRKAAAKDAKGGVRYTAINMLNEHTIELRFFKGTLKPQAVKRNIEFAHAVYAYTKQLTYRAIREADGLTFVAFLTWLGKQDDYENLQEFVADKWEKLREKTDYAVVVEPGPRPPRSYMGCGDPQCCPW